MKKKNTKVITKCSQYNVIMTVIDEFQQLNLFVFELLFYVISDMSIKPIVKFIIFLASLLKKSINYLKNVIFYKILSILGREMRPFFNREIFILLWGLRPRPKLPWPWAGLNISHH